jgi:hypothetical protein
MTDRVEYWADYAKRFGTEMVFESATELNRKDLERLARRLREMDPKWRPPPNWQKRASAVVKARSCARCGRALTGRSDRRTCGGTCRVALHRAEMVGQAPN